MRQARPGQRGHRWVTGLSGACVAGGAVLLGVAACAQTSPPEPPLSTPAPNSTLPAGSIPASGTAPTPAHVSEPAPEPVSVSIPAIRVSSPLLHLGLAADGSAAVPPPGPDYDKAAWFTGSPAPGALGPAVIEGHIDSAADGPLVFYRLGALKAGDRINVTRADGSTVAFTVTRAARYAKDAFPTLAVYGNTPDPELRLITCGGTFDTRTGHYTDNTVIYASHASHA